MPYPATTCANEGGLVIKIIIGLAMLLATPAVNNADTSPFSATQVSADVHLLSTPPDYAGPVIGNVSIIEQSDGFVVVDSGLSAGNGRTIVDYVRSRSGKPIKAVVITHWHNDHPQGVSAIRDAWPGVRIIATEETKKGMLGPQLGPLVGLKATADHHTAMLKAVAETQERLDRQIADPASTPEQRDRAKRSKRDFARLASGYTGTHVVPPTETFDRQLTIDDAQVPVKLLFLGRANTAGDAIVWLPRQKIVITGDVVVWPTPFGFFSYPSDWVRTLGAIKALGYETLIPGHGEPQTDTAYVDQLIGSIEDIRAQVAPMAKAGLSLEEVQEKVDFSRYSELFGTTERRKSLFKAYWTDPMVENAWKEAKGLQIVQGEGEVTVSKQSESARKN